MEILTFLARAIFLIICDHQDTKYEWWFIYINIKQPILTKKIPKAIWYNNIHTLHDWWKCCGNSLYFWIQSYSSTILISPGHWIWVIWNRNEHISNNIHWRKYIKVSMGKRYTNCKGWEKNIVVIFISLKVETFSYYFVITKTRNLSNVR